MSEETPKQVDPFKALVIEVLRGQWPTISAEAATARATMAADVIITRMKKAEMAIIDRRDLRKIAIQLDVSDAELAEKNQTIDECLAWHAANLAQNVLPGTLMSERLINVLHARTHARPGYRAVISTLIFTPGSTELKAAEEAQAKLAAVDAIGNG